MSEIINVGMSDIIITSRGSVLKVIGLGSCVALVVYDIKSNYSALAHIMLPSAENMPNAVSPGRYADTALAYIMGKFSSKGILHKNIRAKMAGGSCMFKKIQKEKLNIGKKNILCIRGLLKHYQVPLLKEDTGGSYGRTIEFYTEKKLLLIKSHKFGIINL